MQVLGIPDPSIFMPGSLVAAQQAGYANQPKSAPIAEALVRAEKAAALAQSLADRAASIVANIIGSAPESTGGVSGAEPRDQSPVVVRQLNDRITDTFTALNRIDAQLGRLAAALG